MKKLFDKGNLVVEDHGETLMVKIRAGGGYLNTRVGKAELLAALVPPRREFVAVPIEPEPPVVAPVKPEPPIVVSDYTSGELQLMFMQQRAQIRELQTRCENIEAAAEAEKETVRGWVQLEMEDLKFGLLSQFD